MVTLKDIAREAGVSITTVSYVLNECGNISDPVRKRVLELMEKHGYKRRIRRKTSNKRLYGITQGQVALVFPDVQSNYRRKVGGAYLDTILSALEEVLSTCDVNLMITKMNEDGSLPDCIQHATVDGAIVFSDKDKEAPVPVVNFASPLSSLTTDTVLSDHEACGRLAATVLAEAGCKSCAFVNPLTSHPGFVLRKQGFLEQLAQIGVTAIAIEKADYEDDPSVTSELVAEIQRTRPQLDGIFIPGSDINVAAIVMELRKQGISPSDQIKVVSCVSNIELLEPLNLGLDYIDIRLRDMGRAAGELLLWRLQNPDAAVRKVMIQPTRITH